MKARHNRLVLQLWRNLISGRTDEQIGAAMRRQVLPRRRAKVLDMDQLLRLAMAGCSIPEIAAEMGVTEKTIDRRLRHDLLFRATYQRGIAKGNAAIRIAQFRKAVIDHDLNALIWAGKVRLGSSSGAKWASWNWAEAETRGHHYSPRDAS